VRTDDGGIPFATLAFVPTDEKRTSLAMGHTPTTATHFFRSADIGAFALRSGTAGSVRSAAELFGAGVTASSKSSRLVTNTDGDYAACAQATAAATRPPPRCSAAVRLQLTALR
jgi:uncharacterized protein